MSVVRGRMESALQSSESSSISRSKSVLWGNSAPTRTALRSSILYSSIFPPCNKTSHLPLCCCSAMPFLFLRYAFLIPSLCLSYSSGYPQALPFFIKKKERRREGRRAERKYRRIRNAVSWKKASGRISIIRLKAGSNSQFPCEKKRR